MSYRQPSCAGAQCPLLCLGDADPDGLAVVTAFLQQGVRDLDADKVHKVSIVPHGIGALGYTLQRPSEDRHLLRRGELLDRLAVLLGGRAAEVLVFGEPTTGAADDLVKATNLARDMVLRYGMDSGLGPVVYVAQRSPFLESPSDAASTVASSAAGEKTAQRIDDAVQGLIEQETKRATQLLRDRREILDRCVRALMSKETLDEAELLALVVGPDASHTGPADDGRKEAAASDAGAGAKTKTEAETEEPEGVRPRAAEPAVPRALA